MGPLGEAADWFCFWTAHEEGAYSGESCANRVLHRATGYSWQWGPGCKHQDNPGLTGLCVFTGERQTQGYWQKVDVILSLHTHTHPWLLVAVLPLKLISLSQISSPLSGQHPNIPRNAVVSNRVGAPSCIPGEQNTQILISPGELLHLHPFPVYPTACHRLSYVTSPSCCAATIYLSLLPSCRYTTKYSVYLLDYSNMPGWQFLFFLVLPGTLSLYVAYGHMVNTSGDLC